MSDDLWDVDDAASESDLGDDWDVDSEEEREKAKVKEEEEAKKKQEAKTIKQKIKEKEEAERKKREERIAELNRVKSEAEKAEEQEAAALKIAMKDMGLDDDFMTPTDTNQSSSSQPKQEQTITTFTPKNKDDMKKYADMLADHVYKFSHKKDFTFLLEQICKTLNERQNEDNWDSVKKLGNSISAIGNGLQQDWKKKTKSGKKKSKKPGLGGYGKDAGEAEPQAEQGYDDLDDFM